MIFPGMFTLVSTTPFPERRLVAKRYRHDCGLEVLSLEANDPENLFVVGFPTDAENDTGAAHIIEHSALEGSERFPVKDPFVCLLKSSVATFLNACTYPDRTIYPFTTCCKQDYFNLLEVYWDAVFHPNLTREILGQEGWHYELHGKGASQKLTINGIVHNEMSGYYSDPGTQMGRAIEKSLFPHSSLRYDSGGVPEKISALTYKGFLDFHASHYNPTVAKVVLYGDIPTEEKLAVLEKHLSQDLPRLPKALPSPKPLRAIKKQPPAAPVVMRERFVPDPESKRTNTGLVAVAWALDETRDVELDLGFQLLEAVLIGNAAAPLSKALMESRIGAAALGSGYDNETKFTSFCVGMRGVKPADFPKFEQIVLDVLTKSVKEGLPKEQVMGALTRFQTLNQEIGRDYIFDMVEDILASWRYSDDPFQFLRQSNQLPKLQELLQRNPRYLEDLIQHWLLDNPKRVRVELHPDDNLKKKTDDALAKKLSKRLATWDAAKKARVVAFQQKLQEIAGREDTPEALATIPVLRRNDLPDKVTPLAYTDGHFANGLRYRKSDDFTNGISRLNLTLDAATLPPDLAQYLPIFTALFPQLGTATKTYDQMATAWAQNGGAYNMTLSAGAPDECPTPVSLNLTLAVYSLDRNFPQAIDLLREKLQTSVFTERKRLVELLKAGAAKGSASLLQRENFQFASQRAADGLNPLATYANFVNGLPAFNLIQKLGRLQENDLDDLINKMERIAQWLITQPIYSVGVATENTAAFQAAEDLTKLWTPAECATDATELFRTAQSTLKAGRREYAIIPAKVHTCVRAFAAPHRSEQDAKPLVIAANILTSGYLWDEIRAKGGAYGCSLRLKLNEKLAFLHAHDDPNCERTYQVFQNIPNFLKEHPFTQEQVDKAILQTLGPFLTPTRPAGAASQCENTLRQGLTNEKRQERFEAFQRITRKQVQDAAERLFQGQFNDCAFGPAPAPQDMTIFQINR